MSNTIREIGILLTKQEGHTYGLAATRVKSKALQSFGEQDHVGQKGEDVSYPFLSTKKIKLKQGLEYIFAHCSSKDNKSGNQVLFSKDPEDGREGQE